MKTTEELRERKRHFEGVYMQMGVPDVIDELEDLMLERAAARHSLLEAIRNSPQEFWYSLPVRLRRKINRYATEVGDKLLIETALKLLDWEKK